MVCGSASEWAVFTLFVVGKNPKWDDLNADQRKLAIAKWHERREKSKPAKDKPKGPDLSREVAPGLTLGELRRQTRTAAQLRYGEEQRLLAHQPGRINNWFDQYQQAIKGAQAAQSQNYADAVQGVQNLQTGLDQASAQQWAGQQASMAADAAKRGATLDPVLADQAHNASNVRNALTGSYGAMLVGQGAAENAYLGKRKINADVGRIDSLKLNAQERRRLLREKGAFKVEYRDKAKSTAFNNALSAALRENTIQNTLADNVRADAALDNTITNTRADNKRSRAQWRNTLNKFGYTNGEWAHMSAAEREAARKAAAKKPASDKDRDPVTGPGSLTQSQENKVVSQIETVRGLFDTGTIEVTDANGKVRRITGLAAIKNYLRTVKTMDPRVIAVADSLYRNDGRIGRAGVEQAHNLGIHVGGRWHLAPRGLKKKNKPIQVDLF